jgi:hypothetical protein
MQFYRSFLLTICSHDCEWTFTAFTMPASFVRRLSQKLNHVVKQEILLVIRSRGVMV